MMVQDSAEKRAALTAVIIVSIVTLLVWVFSPYPVLSKGSTGEILLSIFALVALQAITLWPIMLLFIDLGYFD